MYICVCVCVCIYLGKQAQITDEARKVFDSDVVHFARERFASANTFQE